MVATQHQQQLATQYQARIFTDWLKEMPEERFHQQGLLFTWPVRSFVMTIKYLLPLMAIADGVDIITISIGKDVPFPYENDTIAIGAFHAMEKGILTVQAAGNSGPDPFTVSSHAPWIISVAASSTDRRIIDKTVLGNGQTFVVSCFNISNLCHSPSHFFQIYFVIIIYRGTLCCYCDSCPSLHLSSGT
jgi:hypothetical protein